MSQFIDGIFENGLLRPTQPLHLSEGERVRLVVQSSKDEPFSSNLADLFDEEYVAECAKKSPPSISLEELRSRLSTISGSMDDAIDETRGEY